MRSAAVQGLSARGAAAARADQAQAAAPPPSGALRVLHVSKSAAEFSYHESLIRQLCARGHAVHALFDRGYSEQRSDRAVRTFAEQTGGFSTGWAIRPGSWQRRAATALHEMATLSSYLQRTEQSPFYLERFENGMSPWLRRVAKQARIRALLHRPSTPVRLRRMLDRVPADPDVLRYLRAFRPDVVIASPANMRHSFEAEYLRAAQRLEIPTAIPVFSWDNLTTKSLFPVVPDLLLTWSEAQLREASEIHHVPGERVAVTGAPLFDRWSDERLGRRSREEFCARVGLDPHRPFVCYLGSTAGIAQDETWVVHELSEAIRTHPSERVRGLGILVRPHPLHTAVYEELRDPGVQVWPRGGDMPDSLDALQDFHDTLRFSVAAIGINTTGMLDAVVVDRPCIAVMAERYRRTQEQALHFQHLRRGGVLEEVDAPAGCLEVVVALLDGDDRRAEQRRRFVQQFIRPDGPHAPAGAAAAAAVEALVERRVRNRAAQS
jgi:hypothetical protein